MATETTPAAPADDWVWIVGGATIDQMCLLQVRREANPVAHPEMLGGPIRFRRACFIAASGREVSLRKAHIYSFFLLNEMEGVIRLNWAAPVHEESIENARKLWGELSIERVVGAAASKVLRLPPT